MSSAATCFVVRDHNYFEDEPGRQSKSRAPIHCDLGYRALAQAVLSAS